MATPKEKELPKVQATIIKADEPEADNRLFAMSPIRKADHPVQMQAEDAYAASDWLEPDLDPEGLGTMVENSVILPQCIGAYKSNIAGYGIGIKYIDDDLEETPESKAEWDMLQDVINLLTVDEDTKELFEDIIEARETYGVAYVEVIRNREGNVVQLDMIEDVPSVRITRPLDPYIDYSYFYHGEEIRRRKKFKKYKQTEGGKTIYFKEFGDPRTMDNRSGEYTEGIAEDNKANEIISFAIGRKPYGQVRWIGQILGCDGARRAEMLNNNYFINGRHTPLMIVVKGGSLTDDSYNKIRQYMNDIRGANGQHAFLLLEAESTETDFEAKQPDIEIKDLASILQKDELFQEYIENTRRRVQSSFNLPDLYVGYATDFNRATAQVIQETTEKQVFQPERGSLAWVINNRLLNGYNLKYCEIEFKAPKITNPDDLYKMLLVTREAGGLTPNKAKQIAYDAIGEESTDYEEEWGEIPIVVQNALKGAGTVYPEGQINPSPANKNASTGQNAGEGGIQVDDETLKQLDGQINKAEKAAEPDEVVAVMKEVRNLLLDIRKSEAGADG